MTGLADPTVTKDEAMASDEKTGVFRAESVTHDYSGVVVLFDVGLELRTGVVEGLVGENGSGKSTLIKILTGAQKPTRGELRTNGRVLEFRAPADAQREGLGVIHQDYNLVTDLTVAENVLRLNSKPPRRRWSARVDRRGVNDRVDELFASLGVEVPPEAVVRNLPLAERKFVEIARAMLLRPRFLILDEPTASLGPQDADKVLMLIDRLRSRGVGVLFVSHRLDEVLRIADHITVLRDGRVVGRLGQSEFTEEGLARLIVGERAMMDPASGPDDIQRQTGQRQDLDAGVALRQRQDPDAGVALRMFGVPAANEALERQLAVASGEILGLTGLLGSGATKVTRMLAGVMPAKTEVEVLGRRVEIGSPHDARQAGIGFIPEDRKALGVVPDQSVALNVSLASLSAVSSRGVLSRSQVNERAREYRTKLRIKLASIHSPARTLSGGNAQKMLIARWLASGVRILVVEEPTHGIDIGAKEQVHALLEQFAAAGGSIVLASTDVNDVLTLCDRIAIFHHGILDEVLSTEQIAEAASRLESSGSGEQHLLERLITVARTVR
jgi:ABC-type sugar transport system ATPase subunit